MKTWTRLVAITCVAAVIGLAGFAGCESNEAGGDDPCKNADCDPLATCIADGSSYTCECPAGYNDVNGDGTSCVDIDECAEGLDDCDDVATCTNVDGGYTCTCPADHTDVNGDGTLCEPPVCTAEGDSHAVMPNAPDCCAGLTEVGCDTPDGSGSCVACAGSTYCTNCGDGICGLGENECRCPNDCDAPGCIVEGGTRQVVPGAPPCCAGLAEIAFSTPGPGGTCQTTTGLTICAYCEDGSCGPGENVCNCPGDC